MRHARRSLCPQPQRKVLWAALCVALAALLVWLVFVWQPQDAASDAPLPAGGNFTLSSADGPVSLADYRGRVVAVYFGYTFCPDICPTSLTLLGEALRQLKDDELARVGSLMITLDPERDSTDVLKIYAPFFHPSIVGLSGTPQQIAAVAAQYGVRYRKQPADADGRYAVDHSAYTYLVAADGRLAARLAHGTPPTAIVQALRTLLAQSR